LNLRREFDWANPSFPIGTPFWHDSSFKSFMELNPQLKGIEKYLPSSLGEEVFDAQNMIEEAWSSYMDHGYGYLFYALVRVLKPISCVELGVLQGFSLMTVAAALRDNNNGARICGFDLFEDYEYRHDYQANVSARVKDNLLDPWVRLHRLDAYQVYHQYEAVDFLHVDISNNGETFSQIFAQWANKVKQAIVFEGGSKTRDQVEWMSKYNKPPIVPAIRTIRNSYPDWSIVVLEPFPSVTVAIKKIDDETNGCTLSEF